MMATQSIQVMDELMLELSKMNGTVKTMCYLKVYVFQDEAMESMMMTKNEMT